LFPLLFSPALATGVIVSAIAADAASATHARANAPSSSPRRRVVVARIVVVARLARVFVVRTARVVVVVVVVVVVIAIARAVASRSVVARRARAEARGDAGRRSVAARARRARARATVGAVVNDATTRASGARGVDGARRTRDARDYWFPVCFSGNLRDKDALVAFDLFNVPWVLFRGRDGEVGCVKDECCHRACPLSLGKVVDGRVQCPYHGWEYETNGECAKMPSCSFLKNVFADELRVIERDGMIFVWAGESDPADFVGPEAACESWDEDVYEANEPGMFTTGEGFVTMAEVIADVKLDSDVVVERLLDITERARREPVSVKNRGRGALFPVDGTRLISKVLRIGYDAVPQSVVFKPSCVIASTIALRPRVGGGDGTSMQVEQLHVCLPAKPGLTRVLFRMAFDFVPEGAQNAAGDVWKNLAMQVLQEELEDVRSAGLKSETTSIAVESFRVFKRGDK
jgi:chlorophyllide a oxygenase